MSIADNIKQIRKQKHISQKELAAKLGVGQSTLSSWETGVNKIDTDTLMRIAELLGVGLQDLIGLEAFKVREYYEKWTEATKINIKPISEELASPKNDFRLIPYVTAYRIENNEVTRETSGSDFVHVSRLGDLVYYALPSPNLFERGIFKGMVALVRENARRLMSNSFIIASIDNGPVDVYRITFPEEGKMDFLLDKMGVTGVKFFSEAEINRVKIIGEILEVKQIINPH